GQRLVDLFCLARNLAARDPDAANLSKSFARVWCDAKPDDRLADCQLLSLHDRVRDSDIIFRYLYRRPVRFRRESEWFYLRWRRCDWRDRPRRPSWTLSQPIWREAVGDGWNGVVSDQYF